MKNYFLPFFISSSKRVSKKSIYALIFGEMLGKEFFSGINEVSQSLDVRLVANFINDRLTHYCFERKIEKFIELPNE